MHPDTICTADGAQLSEGDRAFNHYDRKPGVIERIEAYAQPDVMKGQSHSTPVEEWSDHWFDFRHDDGTAAILNGARVVTLAFAQRKGWTQ